MADNIKVKIRGKEFSLKGENENAIHFAADKVDNEIKTLEKSHLTQSMETVAILAALNIAEEQYNNEKQFKIDENYLASELDKMADNLAEIALTK